MNSRMLDQNTNRRKDDTQRCDGFDFQIMHTYSRAAQKTRTIFVFALAQWFDRNGYRGDRI